MPRPLIPCLIALAALATTAPASPAAGSADPVFTEFVGGVAPGFSANSFPQGIALGPDGNVWMAQWQTPGRIGKVTPAGAVTEFTGGVTPNLRYGRRLTDIARGPDGNLWVTDNAYEGGVVKITPGGAVTEYPRLVSGGTYSTAITAGPDGNLWVTEAGSPGRIVKLTTAGVTTTVAVAGETAGFAAGARPRDIAAGPDGNLWFTQTTSPARIGRITPAGTVTEFIGGVTPGLSADGELAEITAGPDGNLWFTDYTGRIGRITPAGVVTEFATTARGPHGITRGPDGALWFTQGLSPGGIGRITTAGAITEFPAGTTPGFTADRVPTSITTGADGNLWFTEGINPGAVVRVAPGTVDPQPTASPTATATATTDPIATAIPTVGPGPLPAQPPQVTAVTSGVPMVAGSPALLSAAVLGSAQHIDWDLNGDGRTEVSCPGDQPTLSYRPTARAGLARASQLTGQISVKAVGAAGAGAALSQTFDVAPAIPSALSGAVKNAVVDIYADQPSVYVCGLARDYAPSQTELLGGPSGLNKPCYGVTVIAGTLNVRGCLARVERLADIPSAERGIVSQLAQTLGIRSGPASQTTVGTAVGALDGFVTARPVLVNGVELKPGSGASIVLYTQVDKILSSNAAMTVGGIALANKAGFSLDTRPDRGGEIRLDDIPLRPGTSNELGGLAIPADARVGVTLMAGTAQAPKGAKISVDLQLPSFLTLGGAPPVARVDLHVTPDGSLRLEEMHIELPSVKIGLMEVSNLKLSFVREGRDEVWNGQGKVCFLTACVDASEDQTKPKPWGGIRIRNGRFDRAYVNVHLTPPIPLYANVNLTDVGGGLELDPTVLLGTVGVDAMSIYKIDGRVAIAFPSKADPYTLSIGGFPKEDYEKQFERFTLAAAGEAHLRIEALKNLSVKLGSAFFVFQAPGYVHVGGEINQTFGVDDFPAVIRLTGRTSGEFNLENRRFNFGQEIVACFVEVICRSAVTRISTKGVGGCYSMGVEDFLGIEATVTMGGGVLFDPFEVLPSLTGCRWSAFEDRGVFTGKPSAAQASAAGSFTIKIEKGDPSRNVRIDGVAGAPLVRVTAPGGQVLDSPAEPGTALTPALRILRSDQIDSTIVGLYDPKPGTYKFDLLPGSPAIAKVTEAEDPGPPKVDARVRGTGARRTLTYDVQRRPGQQVTFVEVASGGKRTIGTTAGGRGTLTFTPAPGTDRRTVEAQFELAGIGAETKTVAAFTPPNPRLGRPTKLTVRRRGGGLQIAWKRVQEAVSYEVLTTVAGGNQRITRSRRPAASIKRVAASAGGRVTVRAIAPMRQGATTTVRFRATAKPKAGRFHPLPK